MYGGLYEPGHPLADEQGFRKDVLEMVRRATKILQKDGFDLSWIHYTHLALWYSRLGYEPVLWWNREGILREKT